MSNLYPQTGIPGAAIVIVQNNSIIYENTLGVRDLASGAPVDSNTLFGIGSATKQFTSTNIAQLVGQGIMSWDDPVIKYYPNSSQFELYDTNVTDSITIRDCLTHRSGLPSYGGDENGEFFNYSYPYDLYKLRYLQNSTPFRSTFQYNNMIYSLAGYCAAKATNTTWDNLIKGDLLDPLGMTDATSNYTDFINSPDHATPYTLLSNGTLRPWDMPVDFIGPAGTLDLSINDMATWLKFQINDTGIYNGQQIVSKTELDETRTGQINTTGAHFTAYGSEYGFGWFIGNNNIDHGGNLLAFHSMVSIYPSQGLGIAILTNGGPYADAFRTSLYSKFSYLLNGDDTTDPWPAQQQVAETTLQPVLPPLNSSTPAQPYSTYTGIYSCVSPDLLASDNLTITTNNNNSSLICYYGNNSDSYDLKHWNDSVFTEPTNNLVIEFKDINNSTSNQLTIYGLGDFNRTQ